MRRNAINVERLRQLCAKNLNAVQIAGRLGVTPDAVREVCKRHGIAVAAAPNGKTAICSASGASLHTGSYGSGNHD